jgi:rhomboid protease GluP
MRLPVHPESMRTHEVPYSAIIAVGEGGRPNRRHFFIESGRRIYHLPQQLFAQDSGPEALFAVLRQRLQALPHGTRLLADTERERSQALRAMHVRPMVTQALLGINGVFFLNTWLKGALDVPFGLLRWGANAPALVYRGELYRLAAANFLHGHWLHVTMNMLALWYLGSLMERLLGWARFSILYLVAGALAMAASAYSAGAVMTVGASGAIFGLLGAFAVISLRLRRALPMGVRQTPRWWLSMFLINTFIPLLWPVVDLTAHLAGFVSGALISLMLLGRSRRVPGPSGRATAGAAMALMAVYACALGQAVICAANTSASQEMRFGQLLLADARTSAQTLNTLAWLWMADPTSTQKHLLAAQDAAGEAVARDPSVPEYHATRAMVCQRLKDLGCAQDAWRRAMEAAYGAQGPRGVIRNDGGVPALYAYQFARVLEQATLLAPPKADDKPLALSRYRDRWRLEVPQGRTVGPRAYLLGEGVSDSAVVLVQWWVPQGAGTLELPQDLSSALNDAGVRQVHVVHQGPAELSGPTAAGDGPNWALWRLPAAAEGDDDP